MAKKISSPAETLPALWTAELLLARVGRLVADQSPLHGKPLPALRTYVGLLPCVLPFVFHEVRFLGKAPPAQRAGKSIFVAVNPLVSDERYFMSEAFAAFGTGVRLLPDVHELPVSVEARLFTETFPALRTQERFIFSFWYTMGKRGGEPPFIRIWWKGLNGTVPTLVKIP